jgi:hypothetical protein
MTIAAGFVCSDGIVIAADTQETGYMKTEVCKYEFAMTDSWIGAVLGAGDAEYVEMCKQKMVWHFARSESSPVPSLEEMEDYALELFQRHFAPLSVYSARERPEAHMLIAIQPKGKTGRLATWLGTAFVSRFPSAFVGIGGQMAVNIERRFVGAGLVMSPMMRVSAVAIYLLSQIKAVVDGCGGNTEVMLLGQDGHSHRIHRDIVREREEAYRLLDWKQMVQLAEKIMDDAPATEDVIW